MGNFKFLIFVFLTIAAWGLYGPVLHTGQVALGNGPKELARWSPLVCVGLAYFLIAVIYPLVMIRREGKGNWSPSGMFWSFSAGIVGAVGALGIIFAFMFGGKPIYVMPLVFGFAPVINCFVTAMMARTIRQASTTFYVGVLIVAIGGAGVMFFKPSAPEKHAMASELLIGPSTVQETDSPTSQSPVSDVAVTDTSPSVQPAGSTSPWHTPLMFASIALTAMCWGSYGPVLHKGQAKMGGSRLRPFLFVGLAYLVVAVILPLTFWQVLPPDPGSLNANGIIWSLLAGAVGAGGALGIIYAFNFGGKPIMIMPLVFGGAPVINTLVTTISNNSFGQLSVWFFASLFLVIAGAITVLVNAPRGEHVPVPKPEIS
jgi:hypothetical protein